VVVFLRALFFFQAEDGIRDSSVTRVQTCALPIFIAVLGESITDLLEPWPLKIVFDYVFGSKRMPDWLASVVSYLGTDKFSILNRSEERRVGKECRYVGAQYR